MKTGRTLSELAAEIERQHEVKKDYVAPVSALRMDDAANISFDVGGSRALLPLNQLAHRQVGEWAKVPAPYYDKMQASAPELLAKNLNHWFVHSEDKRMVRTLDGRMRAFLSDRFRTLDNYDLAQAALPALAKLAVEIISCEVTEHRLYIKAVDRRVVRQVEGRHIIDGRQVEYDDVSPAITISNSEVGSGRLAVDVSMFKHGCKNMAIFMESSLRKFHLGKPHELADGMTALLSDKTRRLTDAATWSQVGDVVAGAFDATRFERSVEAVQGLTSQRIESDVTKVVEVVAKRFNMVETEKTSVLRHLIEGGDLSRFGLLNAVTRTAEDLPSYDRATEFERIGGAVIDLPANDWQVIAQAA